MSDLVDFISDLYIPNSQSSGTRESYCPDTSEITPKNMDKFDRNQHRT